MIQTAVGPTANVLAAARQSGMQIIYLKMAFRADLSDLGAADAPNRMRHLHFGVGESMRAPNGTEGRFLIRDTWNTDIVAELEPQADDIVIYKHRYSGFYQTDMDMILKQLGVKYLIVTGCTTSGCVRATVVDGCSYRLRMIVVEECVYDRHEATRAMNLFDMDQKYADVLSLDEVSEWMRNYAKD